MKIKVIGGILMILGTSIGAGMLALPVATAHENYWTSVELLLLAWLVMTVGALALLEVNLWLPENSNLVSMAKATLGFWGQIITWLVYLLLLYSVLCAYIAGSSDILRAILIAIHIPISQWLATILTTTILGYIVFRGIVSVDMINRGLMSAKLIIFVVLIVTIMPRIKLHNLFLGDYGFRIDAFMVMITAFAYAIIIPSLRSYFNSDVKKLRLIILIGSCIPLVVYLLWITAIQGLIPSAGADGLLHIAESGHTTSLLMTATSKYIHSAWLGKFADVFISICAITSFLGVALCLSDFLADGLQIKKTKGKIIIPTLTFLPPLLIVIFAPGIFVKALSYAGIFCVILLILLPIVMWFKGRSKLHHPYNGPNS